MSDLEPAPGWRFTREEDGSVTICGTGHVTLDPDVWASTCAALSARGESGDTVRMARSFHAMAPRRMETV
jgi:hypothetical protein